MQLSKDLILEYSKRYDSRPEAASDIKVEKELREWFISNRFLDRVHFIKLGVWKSPRTEGHYKHRLNTDVRIKELTSIALASKDEYIRIMAPQLLRGVSWGVASTILHFAFPDEYMILDFRAVWSLEWERPKQYDFDFWQKYTKRAKELSEELNVPIRTLDKALWQYSKENQKK
ncbi:MAG: hypothetical protein ABH880_02250 [Patescibacteria group bacterium]